MDTQIRSEQLRYTVNHCRSDSNRIQK